MWRSDAVGRDHRAGDILNTESVEDSLHTMLNVCDV